MVPQCADVRFSFVGVVCFPTRSCVPRTLHVRIVGVALVSKSMCSRGPVLLEPLGSCFIDAPRGEGYRYCERDKSQAQHDLGETAVLLLKGKENVHFKGQLGRHCGTEVPSIKVDR